MKKHFKDVVKKVLENVAVASSETTSSAGLYQPKTPKTLIKSDKKKVG